MAEDMEEIYAGREMRFELHEQGHLFVRMNPSLAASLVSNLLKNAYMPRHSCNAIVTVFSRIFLQALQ